MSSSQPVQCTDHGDEVWFYCGTCEELLCMDCVSSSHKQHDFCPIKKCAEKVMVSVTKTLDETRAKSQEQAAVIDGRLAEIGGTKKVLQSFEQEVHQSTDSVRSILRQLSDHKKLITSRSVQFEDVNHLLRNLQEEVSASLIDELHRRVKFTSDDLPDASEEKSCIVDIATAYMVSQFPIYLTYVKYIRTMRKRTNYNAFSNRLNG